MKLLLKPPIYLIFLFGLVLFTSCHKDSSLNSPNGSFDKEAFQKDLHQNQHFISYMDARASLYHAINNHNIDLVAINEFVKGNEITDLCSVDPALLKDIKGAELYTQLFCEGIKANMLRVFQSMENELSHFTNQEVWQLFAYNPTETVLRASCLQAFNNHVNFSVGLCNNLDEEGFFPSDEFGTYSECINLGYDAALEVYDDCCASGGYGCPP